MKRRILRSFFSFCYFWGICFAQYFWSILYTLKTTHTDNTTKMRADTHTGRQANTRTRTCTHTYSHALIWSGQSAHKRRGSSTLYSFTRFSVFAVSACVCVCVRVRSYVQCMPKCWLTFKTWAAAGWLAACKIIHFCYCVLQSEYLHKFLRVYTIHTYIFMCVCMCA